MKSPDFIYYPKLPVLQTQTGILQIIHNEVPEAESIKRTLATLGLWGNEVTRLTLTRHLKILRTRGLIENSLPLQITKEGEELSLTHQEILRRIFSLEPQIENEIQADAIITPEAAILESLRRSEGTNIKATQRNNQINGNILRRTTLYRKGEELIAGQWIKYGKCENLEDKKEGRTQLLILTQKGLIAACINRVFIAQLLNLEVAEEDFDVSKWT